MVRVPRLPIPPRLSVSRHSWRIPGNCPNPQRHRDRYRERTIGTIASDRITPDMPTRTRSRCRSIRRPVLGCERLESRSMLAADLEMVDPTALVDAPLPPDTAFLADPLPADSIDSGAGCDWELLVACDGLVIVATDWDDTSTAESVPPDAPFDDGIPLGDRTVPISCFRSPAR